MSQIAGVLGLEPRLTGPEPVGLPITPYPMGSTLASRAMTLPDGRSGTKTGLGCVVPTAAPPTALVPMPCRLPQLLRCDYPLARLPSLSTSPTSSVRPPACPSPARCRLSLPTVRLLATPALVPVGFPSPSDSVKTRRRGRRGYDLGSLAGSPTSVGFCGVGGGASPSRHGEAPLCMAATPCRVTGCRARWYVRGPRDRSPLARAVGRAV